MRRVLSVPRNAFVEARAAESALLVDARSYYCTVYRALQTAQQQVFVSGWQFDTQVKLLRGEDASRTALPVELIAFLAALCEARPSLTIHILAWDFSLVYAQERESRQREKFNAAHPRIRFEWDTHPELRASHHQKFVVIDGALAFLGGIDLCDARWDDRCHHACNPERVNVAGAPCKPYHDVQAAVTGEIVTSLSEIFVERWALATGERLQAVSSNEHHFDLQRLSNGSAETIHCERAALSRTRSDSRAEPALVGEIFSLICDALAAAEQLIYLETQYFTSRALARRFVERLSDESLPKLDIVLVMPHGADSGLEKLALEDAQEGALEAVISAARGYGHPICVMYPTSIDDNGAELPTFIHAKLMIVDDELLVVGSANLTERSLALDSELSVAWECRDEQDPLRACIRGIRTRLLAEHSGLAAEEFELQRGLCAKLSPLLSSRSSRLRQREIGDSSVVGLLLAEVFDPGKKELLGGVSKQSEAEHNDHDSCSQPETH